MTNGVFRSKEILEGYALHILQTIQEFFFVDAAILKFPNLQPDFVIRNRSLYDIILFRGYSIPVLQNEIGPFFRILFKS